MSYLIIPVKKSSSGDENTMMPAFFMQLISAVILSIVMTKKWLPNIHGWTRFGICVLAVVIILALSFLPIIGAVICIANGIVWIVAFWSLFGGISIIWLRWTLRFIAIFLILVFESVPVLNSLMGWR